MKQLLFGLHLQVMGFSSDRSSISNNSGSNNNNNNNNNKNNKKNGATSFCLQLWEGLSDTITTTITITAAE